MTGTALCKGVAGEAKNLLVGAKWTPAGLTLSAFNRARLYSRKTKFSFFCSRLCRRIFWNFVCCLGLLTRNVVQQEKFPKYVSLLLVFCVKNQEIEKKIDTSLVSGFSQIFSRKHFIFLHAVFYG